MSSESTNELLKLLYEDFALRCSSEEPTSNNSENRAQFQDHLKTPYKPNTDSIPSSEFLLRRIEGLKNEQNILILNMISLYKTAKEEIDRKDAIIDEQNKTIDELRRIKNNKL